LINIIYSSESIVKEGKDMKKIRLAFPIVGFLVLALFVQSCAQKSEEVQALKKEIEALKKETEQVKKETEELKKEAQDLKAMAEEINRKIDELSR
jgi:uncharacterized protein YoxC